MIGLPMLWYIIRRIVYAVPTVVGVNVITFMLFFSVNTADDMARAHLGTKHITVETVQRWKHQYGYDKPLFYNTHQTGWKVITDTLFFTKSIHLFSFDFGLSVSGRDIGDDILSRMGPSLAIAIPTLILSVLINISFALFITLFRATWFDAASTVFCMVGMSISGLFYIIFGQYIFAKLFQWAPISGYEGGLHAVRFVWLPVLVGVLSGMGAGVRWYRAIFFEEMGKEYVRTAYAKGLSDLRILYVHILKNALLPIVTGVVVIIPSLFLGSLVLESFFCIPGLGSYTLDAIQAQDFDVVRVMVFLGTVLYILGLILTDIAYVLLDPRVELNT